MPALLEVRDLSVRFGGVVALDRVSFAVEAGQVVALIGPNGAGKTTLFNVVTRVYRPSHGTVVVDGQPVQTIRAHNVIRHGLARTFQNVALFRSMTVLDNVLVGDHVATRSGWLHASVPLPGAMSAESASRKRALNWLTSLACGIPPTARWRRCRSAFRSASSWRAPWSRAHASSCSTSRPAASATKRWTRWQGCCGECTSSSA